MWNRERIEPAAVSRSPDMPVRLQGGSKLLPGAIVVVSAPSGAGKTSLCQRVCLELEGVRHGISFTTRPPRSHEVHGRDYYFVSTQEFEAMVERGEFLEWATILQHRYGTSRVSLLREVGQGWDVLLSIDVQGAKQIKARLGQGIFVFILPPSLQVLRQRLEQRATDTLQEVERRLSWARQEILHYECYDYIIVNDDLEAAVQELKAIIVAERCRVGRMASRIASLGLWPAEEEGQG